MKDVDVMKDILQSRISNQLVYNNTIIDLRNPEIRQLYTQMRDDEMRCIAKLQQKIERLEEGGEGGGVCLAHGGEGEAQVGEAVALEGDGGFDRDLVDVECHQATHQWVVLLLQGECFGKISR